MKMPYLELKLPPGCVVKGGLMVPESDHDLVSDMMEIDLPDGTTLDVGWVPELDPKGHYRVVHFQQYWSNRFGEVTADKLPDVVDAVERLAASAAERVRLEREREVLKEEMRKAVEVYEKIVKGG